MLLPHDPVRYSPCGRMLAGASECGLGDVDRGDLPSRGSKPDGVGTLAASEVQGGARGEGGCFARQDRVHPTTPDAVTLAVSVVPEGDGVDVWCGRPLVCG